MTLFVSNVEVARPPDEVFSYVTDPSRFAEWQEGVLGGRMVGGGPPGVGSRCITIRRIAGVPRPTTSEITEISPATGSWASQGIDGPIRSIVRITVEPLDENERSRVRIELGFEGHGIGKLLVPLVAHRQARRRLPINGRRLKEWLESGDYKARGDLRY